MNYPPGILSAQEAFSRKVYTDHRISWELVNYATSNGRAVFAEVPRLVPSLSALPAGNVVPSLDAAEASGLAA